MMYINVAQTASELDDPEDAGIAGLYQVDFEQDVIDVLPGELAGWAKDLFHSQYGIGYADDFEITVLNEKFEEVGESDDYEDGSHNDQGSIFKISDEPFENPETLSTVEAD